jgi:uncharacterized protein with NRDE domain
MCLVFFSWQSHPDYPLIFASNRDEFADRPTRPAHLWEDQRHILGGKDLKDGGTWLGISRNRRFSAITNYRDIKNIKINAPSRGRLTKDFLTSKADPLTYLFQLEKPSDYNGFNLLVSDFKDFGYYSNYEGKIRILLPGIYGLSNHLLDTPWPKVKEGKTEFQDITKSSKLDIESIFELLYDKKPAPHHLLPDTGIGEEKEKMLSSRFIYAPEDNYGTQASTIVVVKKNGEVVFYERLFSDGRPSSENEFGFSLIR